MRRLTFPAAAIVLVSCALGPSVRITVLLPPLPDAWRAAFPRIDCLLVYPDSSGEVRRTHAAGWESPQVIDCAKEGNAAVLAFPLLPSDADRDQPGVLRPAGGIFPDSVHEAQGLPSLELTWTDGAVARVSAALRSAGLDTSLFNITRLAGEMRETQDPWDLDLDTLMERIVSGGFSVYDIDPLPRRDVRVAVGTGCWVMESPFRAAATADAEGVLDLPGLSTGLHELFTTAGRMVKIDVSATGVICSP